MLSALVLSLVPLVPAWDDGTASLETAHLELVARLGETRMSVYNPGQLPQLLILGELGGVARARTWIAPGAQLDTRFAPGSLAGLALEVVSFTDGGTHSSGMLALEDIASAGYDAFWIETTSQGSHAWGRSGSSLWTIGPGDAGLTGLAFSVPTVRALRPTHVPVVSPSDRKNGDVPPRLERKPLPPL